MITKYNLIRNSKIHDWKLLRRKRNESSGEAYRFLSSQVRSGQRLVASPVPNLAWGGVAATKIEYLNGKTRKVLNPNIEIRNKF